MAVETGLTIVGDAFLIAGIVGQGMQPTAMDTQFGLRLLNNMAAQWTTKRYLIWDLVDIGLTSDGRVLPYTVGPAGDFPCARRPDRIEFAFVRQLGQNQGLPVDTPLKVVQAREQYNLATLKKNFVSYPSLVFLDSAWPQGLLFCYPWPTASVYQIFITIKNVLPVFTLQTLLSSIPDQYAAALKFHLAKRLRGSYGLGGKPNTVLEELCKDSLNTIRNSNLQVPDLNMPIGLPGSGNKIYNIYSDNN